MVAFVVVEVLGSVVVGFADVVVLVVVDAGELPVTEDFSVVDGCSELGLKTVRVVVVDVWVVGSGIFFDFSTVSDCKGCSVVIGSVSPDAGIALVQAVIISRIVTRMVTMEIQYFIFMAASFQYTPDTPTPLPLQHTRK